MTAAAPKSAYQNAQLRVFKILEGDVTEPGSRFCEIFIALLVVLNVVAIILESVPDIHEEWGEFFHYFGANPSGQSGDGTASMSGATGTGSTVAGGSAPKAP